MPTSWAIIIGINQYQGFQPLMQAQNDAVGIRRYLIDDAGFKPENCILLSDLSTSIEQEAVYPDRTAINDWMETICQGRVQPDDTLWFFFSGYGAQADDKDYLMPVDGDPAQIKQTGIALQDVVKYLKQAPTSDIMMVLDMNRSQSALAGQAIGAQVIKRAQKARIPMILSCQADEFSHETLAVRHGLFTAALLEGLRYEGNATLGHLSRYLTERVPELCENHWRPVQNPVVAIPEEQQFKLLWHQREGAPSDSMAMAGLGSDPGSDGEIDTTQGTPNLVPDNPDGEAAFTDDSDGLDFAPIPELNIEDELPEEPVREPFSLEPELEESLSEDKWSTTVDSVPDNEPTKGRAGGCLGGLGALAAFLLLLAVLFRNHPLMQTALRGWLPPTWLERVGLNRDGTDGTPDAGPDDTGIVDPAVDETAPSDPDAAGTDTSGTSVTPDTPEDAIPEAGAAVDNPDPNATDAPETTNTDVGDAAAVGDAEDTPVDEPPSDTVDDPDATTDAAEANDTATDNSVSDTGDTDTPVAAAANTTQAATTPDTAALLADARRSIRPNQASQFATAIATARQIPPGDANYAQAQADIQRWSQVILDLAEGRAAENELEAAINAAKLVPREPALVHQNAQERVRFWQARAQTRELIRAAQAIPRMGQASTYQTGILKLQDVPTDQPIEHADAQRLIGEWSEKMLMIARARAAQSRYGSAIEAASLIPEGTKAYGQAKTEIARWREL